MLLLPHVLLFCCFVQVFSFFFGGVVVKWLVLQSLFKMCFCCCCCCCCFFFFWGGGLKWKENKQYLLNQVCIPSHFTIDSWMSVVVSPRFLLYTIFHPPAVGTI